MTVLARLMCPNELDMLPGKSKHTRQTPFSAAFDAAIY